MIFRRIHDLLDRDLLFISMIYFTFHYQWLVYSLSVLHTGACSFYAQLGGDNLLHHILHSPESFDIWSQKSNQLAEYILANPTRSSHEIKCIKEYLKVTIPKVDLR